MTLGQLSPPEHNVVHCQKRIEEEYKNTLSKEIRDFMRNGDSVILKRVLFKTFANFSTPQRFKRAKANAILMLMMHDVNISSVRLRHVSHPEESWTREPRPSHISHPEESADL